MHEPSNPAPGGSSSPPPEEGWGGAESAKAEKLKRVKEELLKIRQSRQNRGTADGAEPRVPEEARGESIPGPAPSAAVVSGNAAVTAAGNVRPAGPRIPEGKRKGRPRPRRSVPWPFLVWAAAVGLALLIHFGFVRNAPSPGEIASSVHVVSAAETGTVSSFVVSQWDDVVPGQELAKLSSPAVEESLASATAWMARRRGQTLESLRSEIEQLRETLEESETDLGIHERARQVLAEQVEVLRPSGPSETPNPLVSRLMQQNSDYAKDLAALSTDLLEMERELARDRREKERAASGIAKLEAKLKEMEDADPGLVDALSSPEEALECRLLQGRAAALTIRAPIAGSVSALLRAPGERVEAGTPLLEIVEAPRWIVVRLPSDKLPGLKPGSPVWIRPPGGGGATLRTKIVRISSLGLGAGVSSSDGPRIESVPGMRKEHGRLEAGRLREIYIQFPEGGGLVPGLPVLAFFDDPDAPRFTIFRREIRRSLSELAMRIGNP